MKFEETVTYWFECLTRTGVVKRSIIFSPQNFLQVFCCLLESNGHVKKTIRWGKMNRQCQEVRPFRPSESHGCFCRQSTIARQIGWNYDTIVQAIEGHLGSSELSALPSGKQLSICRATFYATFTKFPCTILTKLFKKYIPNIFIHYLPSAK